MKQKFLFSNNYACYTFCRPKVCNELLIFFSFCYNLLNYIEIHTDISMESAARTGERFGIKNKTNLKK